MAGRTIDERLEFLVQSTESLHQTAQEQTTRIDKQTTQIGELSILVKAHEKRWDMTRKILAAALKAALENGENGEGS